MCARTGWHALTGLNQLPCSTPGGRAKTCWGTAMEWLLYMEVTLNPFFLFFFLLTQRYLAKTCWGPQMEGLLFLEVSFVTAECVLRDCSRQVLNPKPKPCILDLKP